MARRAGLLLVWTVGLAGPAAGQDLDLAGIEAAVERARDEFVVPGVALAVVRGEELLWARGFGVCALDGPPVDPHTSFGVASNSKAFTAALLGMAMDEGLLTYDDRIVDHRPDFQMFDPWVTREARLRDFLCHRSGLPQFGGDCLWIGNALSSDEVFDRLRYLEPSAPFRARFQYNNLGWMVAGKVLEKVRGQSWADEVRARILEPLGMDRTDTSWRQLGDRDNVATPYEMRGGVLVAKPYDDMDPVAAAGALHSTVLDMSRWMSLNLGGGEYAGSRLISADRLREMQSVQMALPVSPEVEQRRGTHFAGYGLGWGLSDYRGYKVVTHGGGLTGMISRQLLIPEIGMGVVVLTNRAPNPMTTALCYHVVDDWLGTVEKDWVGEAIETHRRGLQQAQEAEDRRRIERTLGTQPASAPSDYAGSYHNKMAGDAQVRLEDGHLVFDYNRRHLGDLVHWHYETFQVTWRDPIFDMPEKSFLTFERDAEGAITGLKVRFYHVQEFERR